MKLIIDIDEDTYKYMQSRCKYQNKSDKGLSKFEEAGVAIKNGTPLPKGHGELIDRDKIEYLKAIHDAKYGHISWIDAIEKIKHSAPTIIEADKAESEDK